MDKVAVIRPHTTVDLLLWRRHGPGYQRLLAATLDLNPGLAALGPELPIGTELVLPDPPAEIREVRRPVLSLFGDD